MNLHPLLYRWIATSFDRLTQAQELTLPHLLAGRTVLLSSPTGSGKTLAGFLGVLDHLVRAHEAGTLGDRIHCIYVSPLRALTYDIRKNLEPALAGIGLDKEIRIGVRTGDSTSAERAKLRGMEQVVPVSLGPRILRADTAAVAAITLWQSVLGDWA